MSAADDGVICYVGSMKGKSVVYVPDGVEIPEKIKQESFALMVGHGTLYTIRDKHLKTVQDLIKAKGLESEKYHFV